MPQDRLTQALPKRGKSRSAHQNSRHHAGSMMMARLRWTARRTLRAKTFGSIGPEPLEVRRHALRIHVDPSGADSIAFPSDAYVVIVHGSNGMADGERLECIASSDQMVPCCLAFGYNGMRPRNAGRIRAASRHVALTPFGR